MRQNFWNYITPDLLLRLALASVFLYAGINSLLNPESWASFIPGWVDTLLPANAFLVIHGIFEILLALLLLSGFMKKASAAIAFLLLASIIVFYGVDDVTFRDFGLAIAALALFRKTFKS